MHAYFLAIKIKLAITKLEWKCFQIFLALYSFLLITRFIQFKYQYFKCILSETAGF